MVTESTGYLKLIKPFVMKLICQVRLVFAGHTPMYPTQALLNYTKDHHMDIDVNIVNLGTSKQMCDALSVVKECMESGKWVVLDNCHLAAQWSKELLGCIQVID